MDGPAEIGGTANGSSGAERRRNALVGVAVVVVLALAAGAGVLLARSGEERAEQGSAAAGTEVFLLPPEDAEVLTAGVVSRSPEEGYASMAADGPIEDLATYHVLFIGDDGTRYGYSVSRWPATRGEMAMSTALPMEPAAPVAATDARGVLSELGLPDVVPMTDVTVAALDSAVLTCFGRIPRSDGEPGTEGPPGLFGVRGQRWLVSAAPVPDGPTPACEPDASTALVEIANHLRVVREDEWRTFMARWVVRNEIRSGPASIAPATTVDLQGVSIPGEDEARAAVIAAFEGLDHQAPDGTYPNVETGDDVAFWQPFFEEARSTPQITAPGGFTVDDVAFLSEDRARVRYQAHAENDGQQIHIALMGDAVRIGDRWVVSRDTMVQMMNRAVSPDRRR
jgi:hypothetical protein